MESSFILCCVSMHVKVLCNQFVHHWVFWRPPMRKHMQLTMLFNILIINRLFTCCLMSHESELFLIIRIISMSERQRSSFSRIYGYGVASVLFFHLNMLVMAAPFKYCINISSFRFSLLISGF